MPEFFEVGKAHQRKIREEHASEKTLFGGWHPNTSIENAEIRVINRYNAKSIILKYEWLGTLPVNYTKFVGLFFEGHIAGVSCFTNVKFGGKYTLFNHPAYCLGRGACVHWSPKWAGSYLTANGIKALFGKEEPLYIIAYSDWSAGEIGTIYQACNWIYLGHRGTKEWIDTEGKRYDVNTPAVRAAPGYNKRKTGKKQKASKEQIERETQKMIDAGYQLVDGPTRGRYATVAGKRGAKYNELMKKLKKYSKPYPKRKNEIPATVRKEQGFGGGGLFPNENLPQEKGVS